MTTLRARCFRFLFAVAIAGLILAACSSDSSDSEDDQPDGGSENGADSTGDAADSADGDEDAGNDTGSAALTVQGVAYTFEPTICIPDETGGSSVSGPGVGSDGTAIYVDLAAGNLSIYLGIDDPMSADPDFVASSVIGQGVLQEVVNGSTVTVQASLTEREGIEVVADATLNASC